tara:strand:+ start:433 stop:1161 length:729 start_codon:yes stop_codon:yes gene_type:complete
MKSISIIIPAYNYEKLIITKLRKIIKKIKKYKIKYEIIIIDDCSQDSTFFLLQNFIKNKKNIYLLKNSQNKGKSYSVKKGLKISKYNHVIFIDCDLPYFNKIDEIIKKLKDGFDFVAVNRRLKKSKLKSTNLSIYQYIRHFLGFLISEIIMFALNLNIEACDTQAGLKGFKKNLIVNKNFISNKFFLDLELIIFFTKFKRKIHFISTKYEVPKESSIKIFDFKNLLIIGELLKVIIKYKKLI